MVSKYSNKLKETRWKITLKIKLWQNVNSTYMAAWRGVLAGRGAAMILLINLPQRRRHTNMHDTRVMASLSVFPCSTSTWSFTITSYTQQAQHEGWVTNPRVSPLCCRRALLHFFDSFRKSQADWKVVSQIFSLNRLIKKKRKRVGSSVYLFPPAHLNLTIIYHYYYFWH